MGGRVTSPTFVGRVEELQVLDAAGVRAADGEPAVVLVGGEAGVGKTRLVAELARRCAADGTRVLTGGCVPVGDGALPYAPIVEAVRGLVAEVGAGAVRGLVGPSWPELARLLPALGAPDHTGQPDQAAQARLFELLLGLLGGLGGQAPLVLVVEDLHWADRSTRDLLAFLVRNLHRERVLLVISYRNDEPGQQRLRSYLAELDRVGRVERIELSRLDRVQTVAQLVGILGAAPAPELADSVFARSDGNPFFTEELLAVVRSGSQELPATLRDLLRGRVHALPERAQHVLEVVAVAGRQVSHRLLAIVAGLDDQALIEALRAAVASQLLIAAPGQDGYDVRHALLREVINADLLPGERARRHARLARSLMEQPELAGISPALVAAELAVHWDAAGEPTRALPARVQAGQAADAAHAFPEALGHYQRALELWEQLSDLDRAAGLDRIGLLSRAAEAAASTGATEQAIALLEQAIDRVDTTAEPVRAAGLLAQLGFHRFRARPESSVFAAYDEAEQLLAGEGASAEQARVYGFRAHALWVSGRPHAAEPYCQKAIVAAHAIGALAEEAYAVRVLGGCLGDLGEFDQAITLNLKARQLAEQARAADIVVATYVSLTDVLSDAGREREALAAGDEGYRRARELGQARARGSFVARNLAWSMLALGRWEELDRLTADLLAGDCWCAFGLHGVRCLLLTRQGEFILARAEAEQALQLSPAAFRDDGLLPQAELAIWQGHDDEAASVVAEGLRQATEAQEEDHPHHYCSWYPLALRLEADRAERATAQRMPEQTAEARRRAAPVVAALDRLAAWERLPRYPEVGCTLALARAELSRLQGQPNPERWQAAALAWEQLERPFEAAYARFRQAEALLASHAPRSQAQPPLQMAYRTATTLRAAPLKREVELLAQRGRLRLDATIPQASPATMMSPAAAFGLTRREAEVLALVAEGRTNRQIGQALFITPKTASLHVSRILAKLGVDGRGEAAAIAHRLGLDKR